MKILCRLMGHNWYVQSLSDLIKPVWGDVDEWRARIDSPCTRCGVRPSDTL